MEMVGLAGDDTILHAGDLLVALGMGDEVENGQGLEGLDVLHKVELEYVNTSQCQYIYKHTQVFVPEFMLCAGGASSVGRDTCKGDSGGPLVNDDGYQVGLISWGYGCGRPDYPGVYAKVSAEVEWIKRTVCENSTHPPDWACAGGTSSVPPAKIPPRAHGKKILWGWKFIILLSCGSVLISLATYSCIQRICRLLTKTRKRDDHTVEDDFSDNRDAEHG